MRKQSWSLTAASVSKDKIEVFLTKTTSPHVLPRSTTCPRHRLLSPTLGDEFVGTAEAAEDVAPAPARYHLLKNYNEVIKFLKLHQFQPPEEKSRNATHLPVLPMLRGGHSRAKEQEQPASCFYFPLILSATPAPPGLTSTCSRSSGIPPASAARSGGCRTGNPVFCFSSPHQTCAVNDVKAAGKAMTSFGASALGWRLWISVPSGHKGCGRGWCPSLRLLLLLSTVTVPGKSWKIQKQPPSKCWLKENRAPCQCQLLEGSNFPSFSWKLG